MHTRLTRYEKLKSRKLTEALFKANKSVNSHPYRICYLLSNTGFEVPAGKAFGQHCPVQFGVGVSSRHFKKAVDRNRIKRLTREVWRLQKASLYGVIAGRCQLAVFFIFTGRSIAEYDELYKAMGKGIVKLGNIIENQVNEVVS